MTPLLHILQRLIRQGHAPTVAEVFDLARQHHYDGAITFHFRGGLPVRFEAGKPVQIDLAPPDIPVEMRKPLDSPTVIRA